MTSVKGATHKVVVTMSFTSTWYFPHDDLMKIQDSVTRQYHDRIRTIQGDHPMKFKGYDYDITPLSDPFSIHDCN